MNKRYYLLILLGLGLLTRFAFFGHPSETVFDEVHFGKFVSGYYTREYFFDIHPPLGKLAIAGFAKLFDFKPGFAFAEIGNKFPDKQYLVLRFLPGLAGALLPLIIYLLLMEMGIPPISSFFGGLLIVFENALITQSHYILMDSFLLLFGFAALYCYLAWKNGKSKWLLLASGILAGMSVSVKWTGLSFLAIIVVLELLHLWKDRYVSAKKRLLPVFLSLLIVPVAIYFSIFVIHLNLLNKSGPGDAFMSAGFQKTLIGSKYANDPATPSNIFQKFIEVNNEMYKANQGLTATHPYSSQWYSWPLMARPIYYWVDGDARIYLLGNPIIWWLSTVAVLYLVFSILYLVLNRFDTKYKIQNTLYFLLGGYILNLLPFIGVKRVMFLYHYFTAYIFAIMIMVWLISKQKNSKLIFGIILTASVVSFIFFAPLSYGLDLSSKAFKARIWLSGWE